MRQRWQTGMLTKSLSLSGFWMRAKTSVSQYQVHLKLQKVQIDNPNPLSQYPVVLVPVPLPESVGPKPFFEASLIVRQTEHSKNPQYKLIEALLQELEISVDQGKLCITKFVVKCKSTTHSDFTITLM